MSLQAAGLAHYNYPGAESPYHHQKETTNLLVNNLRYQVWNEIGTGKTFSVAWGIDYLIKCGLIRRALIIAPISTLEVVWQRTLWRVNQRLHVAVLKGTADKRNRVLTTANAMSASVSVINPDALHIIADNPACDAFDLVVVDESAMFRNPKSRRYKALHKLVGNFYEERPGTSFGKPITRKVLLKERTARNWSRRFWPMTGSPAPEEPTDVWAISALASPDRVPKHFGEFRDMTMVRVSQFKWEPRKNAEQIVADMLRGTVVRFTRDECFDLPPTVVHTHEVAMTAEQKKLIDTLRKEAAAEVAAGLIKGVNEAVVISKMLQVTSGAVKAINADKVETIHQVDCAPKFQALQELMDATSGPVIVFADFIGAIARLAQYAEINKVPYSMVVGDTPGAKRKAIFDAVQRNEIKMLVAHPKTIAHGVDLTTSNVIAWWNPIYSHEIYEQACGRITRATQRRKTLIVHFVCSALEKLVLRKLTKKSRVQGLLLDYLQGEA